VRPAPPHWRLDRDDRRDQYWGRDHDNRKDKRHDGRHERWDDDHRAKDRDGRSRW
jgi:hypothetical protein